MTNNKSKGLFWLVVLGGCGLYYYSNSLNGNSTQRSSPPSVGNNKFISIADNSPDLPYAEQQFIKAVHDGHNAYDAAGNDMQKGATRSRRAKSVCSAISSGAAKDWIGKIYKLSSNSDGKGVLEIELASDVWIHTWNNSLSDISDNTLIDPDSTLFQSVSSMSEGQQVKFSGMFVRDATDCYRESSMSISGSMTEPEYVMRFSSASPL